MTSRITLDEEPDQHVHNTAYSKLEPTSESELSHVTADDFAVDDTNDDDDDSDAMPWKLVFPLLMIQISSAINMISVLVYASFMVIDFGLAGRDDAGSYAGYIAASYFVGNALSSYLWGRISDHIGKRICLLLGSAFTAATSVAFAFSPNIGFAIGSRILGGALNGNIGVVKAYLGSVTTARNQGRAFGVIGLAWGVGSVLGAVIGGLLSRPAAKWPTVFSGDLFSKFPYVLPNLFVAVCFIVSFVLTWIYLVEPEVNESKRANSADLKPVWKQLQPMLCCLLYTFSGFASTMGNEIVPLQMTATIPVGGLHWTTNKIGYYNIIIGGFTVFVQLVIYPRFSKRFGMIRTYQTGALLMIPVFVGYPLLNLVANSEAGVWIGLIVIAFVRANAGQFIFSAVFCLVANSVVPTQLGAVNGLGQTFVAIMRTFAPILIGNLFSWTLTNNKSFPLNFWFSFMLLDFIFLLLAIFTLTLSKTLDRPKLDIEMMEDANEMELFTGAQNLDGEVIEDTIEVDLLDEDTIGVDLLDDDLDQVQLGDDIDL